MGSEVQHAKIDALNAKTIFKHIIVGGDEVRAGRKEKPDPGIFAKACELTGVSASEAVHVGDSLSSDVGGALRADLRAAIWVNPSKAKAAEGGPQPHFTIPGVTDLPTIFEKLGLSGDEQLLKKRRTSQEVSPQTA